MVNWKLGRLQTQGRGKRRKQGVNPIEARKTRGEKPSRRNTGSYTAVNPENWTDFGILFNIEEFWRLTGAWDLSYGSENVESKEMNRKSDARSRHVQSSAYH